MKLRKELNIRSIAGENVIIMPQDGAADFTSLINLNDTAKDIWEAMKDREFEKADIIGFIMNNYENVSEEMAKRDTDIFVNQLLQINALEC